MKGMENKMKKEIKMKKENKGIMRFVLVLFFCGILGGILGGLISIGETNIIRVGSLLQKLIKENIIWIEIGVETILISIIALLIGYRKIKYLKKIEKKEEVSEEFEAKFEQISSVILLLNSVNMIIVFTCYGISIGGLNHENMVYSIAALFVMLIFTIIVEVHSIDLIKKRNPLKRGNPLDLRFQKDWLESCDEAEKYIIYSVCYKTYMLMKNALIAVATGLMLLNLVYDVGVLPFFIVGGLWLLQTVSYCLFEMRMAKDNKILNP